MGTQVPFISTRTLIGLTEPIERIVGTRAMKRSLGEADLPEVALYSLRHHIPHASQLLFFDSVSKEAGEDIGIAIGRHASIATFGKFSGYVTAPETLHDALRLACAMLPFNCSFDRSTVECKGELAYFRYYAALRGAPGYRHYAVLAARIMLSIGEPYISGGAVLAHVEFDFPKPQNAADYEALFGCEVRFMQPTMALVLRRAALTKGRRVAPTRLVTMKDIVLEVTSGPPRDVFSSIEALVRVGVDEGSVEMERIAGQLGYGERTMRRKLDEIGISYRDLVLKTRMDRARELIAETQIPITEIAVMLGYSDAAHFGRAFRRMTGMAPGDARRSGIGQQFRMHGRNEPLH